MTAPQTAYEPGRMTARELLVYVAGEDHALHSVATREPLERGQVGFTCSCGASFRVSALKKYLDALRNVAQAVRGKVRR